MSGNQRRWMRGAVHDDEGLKFRLNPSTVIKQITVHLQGWYYDSEGNKQQVLGNVDAMLNEKGTKKVVSLLRANLNRNIVLSNITNKEALQMTQNLSHTLNRCLMLNLEEYGIDTTEDASFIISIVENNVLTSLKRAVEGFEAENLTKVTSYGEQKMIKDEKKQGSGLSSLFSSNTKKKSQTRRY